MTPIDQALYDVLDRYVVNSTWPETLPPLTIYMPDVLDRTKYPCLAVTAAAVDEEGFTLGLVKQTHQYEIVCCAEQSTVADSYALVQNIADRVKAALRRQQLAIAPATTQTVADLPTHSTLFQVADLTQLGMRFYFDLVDSRLWRSALRLERSVADGPFDVVCLSNPTPCGIPAGTSVVSPRVHPFEVTLHESRPEADGLLWETTVTYSFALTAYASGALERV